MHLTLAFLHRKLYTAILGLMKNGWNHMLSSPMKVFKTEPDESIQISLLNKSWLNRCDVFVIYDIAFCFGAQKLVAQQGLDPKRVALNCCWPLVQAPSYFRPPAKGKKWGRWGFYQPPIPGEKMVDLKVERSQSWISTCHLFPLYTFYVRFGTLTNRDTFIESPRKNQFMKVKLRAK